MTDPHRSSQEIFGAYARGDINQTQNVYFSAGSTLGAGIWKWSDWHEKALANQLNSPTAKATQFLSTGNALARAESALLASSVERFLNGDTSVTRTHALWGKHGTGRSTVLMALGTMLAERGIENVYVVDDYARFAQTDLPRVMPSDQKSVILIDDADTQGAYRPVYTCQGHGYIIAIGAFSYYRSAASFMRIGGNQDSPISLSERPDEQQLKTLESLCSPGKLSHYRRKRLAFSNIRTAHRILKGDPPSIDLARSLAELRAAPNVELPISILTWCGLNDIYVPASILVRLLQSALPEDLVPWLQTRPIFGRDGESAAVWIDDRDVLQLAVREWKKQHLVDDDSYRWVVRRDLKALLSAVDSSAVADRLLSRQLIRRAPKTEVSAVVEDCSLTLEKCLQHESDRGSLLAWSMCLPQGEFEHLNRLRTLIVDQTLATNPDFGATLAFVTAESERRRQPGDVSSEAGQLIPDEHWASILEMCEGRSGGVLGRHVLITVIDLLRQHSECRRLLSLRNSMQIIATFLVRTGNHGQRSWLRDLLVAEGHDLSSSSASFLMGVTKRCVMQGRYSVVLSPEWNPAKADAVMVEKLRNEYDNLLGASVFDRTEQVSEVVLALLTSGQLRVGEADQLWTQLVEFSLHFQPDSLISTVEAAWDFVWNTCDRDNLRSCSQTTRKLLTIESRMNYLDEDGLARLLRILDDAQLSQNLFWDHLYRTVSAASSSQIVDTSKAAIDIFRGTLLRDATDRCRAIGEAWQRLISSIGFAPSNSLVSVDGRTIDEAADEERSPIVVVSNTFRYPEAERQSDLEAMVSRWKNHAGVTDTLYSQCISSNFPNTAAKLVPDNWENDATWSVQMARLFAIQGHLTKARRTLESNRKKGTAMPIFVANANREMAKKTRGHEQQVWYLLAALVRPGKLVAEPIV